MPSVFRSSRLCLPMLFYECLAEFSEDGMTEESVERAYSEVFPNHVFMSHDAELIIERLVKEAEEFENAQKGKGVPKQKKTMGTGFLEYISKLDGETSCFFLADHDPIKAKKLYCEVDKHHVEKAAAEKAGYLAEISGVWFEAVMFGMGGHYKGHGPKDKTFDLTADLEGAKEEFKRLGLM